MNSSPSAGLPARGARAVRGRNISSGQNTGGLRSPWYWATPSRDLGQAFVDVPHVGLCRPQEDRSQRPPDRQLVLVRDVQHADPAVAHGLRLLPPQVEEARVVQRIGHRERMAQLRRQSDGTVRALEGAIGESAQPQDAAPAVV